MPEVPGTASPLPSPRHAGQGTTAAQEKFLAGYLGMGLSPEAAARYAGVIPTRAMGRAYAWLRDPVVRRRRAHLEAEALRRMSLDVDLMMRQLVVRATTPATEAIGDLIVPPCRHCHGINHEYQRTHGEMETALDKYESSNAGKHRLPFDPKGGDGYDYLAPPNPDCPNCHGQGDFRHPVHVPVDTRVMSAEGRMLLAGLEVGPDRHKITARNQDTATLQLLGVLKDVMELRREEGGRDAFDLRPAGGAAAKLREIRRIIVRPDGEGSDRVPLVVRTKARDRMILDAED